MDNASEQSTTLTMDFEETLEHAESTHYHVTMLTLSQWDGSVELQRSAQSFRSESRIILNIMKSKFK